MYAAPAPMIGYIAQVPAVLIALTAADGYIVPALVTLYFTSGGDCSCAIISFEIVPLATATAFCCSGSALRKRSGRFVTTSRISLIGPRVSLELPYRPWTWLYTSLIGLLIANATTVLCTGASLFWYCVSVFAALACHEKVVASAGHWDRSGGCRRGQGRLHILCRQHAWITGPRKLSTKLLKRLIRPHTPATERCPFTGVCAFG